MKLINKDTIEQKAKAYDEALEQAKKELNTCGSIDCDAARQIFRFFPELKESEDERIWTINYLNNRKLNSSIIEEKESLKKAIAWLEKQGEQKPADKVEPKFKVGDWITNGINFTFQVISIEDNHYLRSDDYFIDIETVYKTFRLWTIQDAKAGDVLAFNDGHGNDCIELIKSIADKKIEFWFCLANGNRYEVFDGITPYTNFASREDATPATREQRDLLFSKMHEAGYEWDAEKKELKKIEQKPAWCEKEKVRIDRIINVLDWAEEKGRISYSDWEDYVTYVKSLKPQNNQNPAWSEEDEETLDYIIDYIENNKSHDKIYTKKTEILEGMIDWLKYLKERMKIDKKS